VPVRPAVAPSQPVLLLPPLWLLQLLLPPQGCLHGTQAASLLAHRGVEVREGW